MSLSANRVRSTSPDLTTAIAEMRCTRRLATATWKAIERLPLIAIADAPRRYLGAEATDTMRSPVAPGDGTDLARVIADAGYREIVVLDQTTDCTWASHLQFARRAIARTSPTGPSRHPPAAHRGAAAAVPSPLLSRVVGRGIV